MRVWVRALLLLNNNRGLIGVPGKQVPRRETRGARKEYKQCQYDFPLMRAYPLHGC